MGDLSVADAMALSRRDDDYGVMGECGITLNKSIINFIEIIPLSFT